MNCLKFIMWVVLSASSQLTTFNWNIERAGQKFLSQTAAASNQRHLLFGYYDSCLWLLSEYNRHSSKLVHLRWIMWMEESARFSLFRPEWIFLLQLHSVLPHQQLNHKLPGWGQLWHVKRKVLPLQRWLPSGRNTEQNKALSWRKDQLQGRNPTGNTSEYSLSSACLFWAHIPPQYRLPLKSN